MKQLAEHYATLRHTKVIASWLHENSITFVFESGHKLTMSTRQLEEAIAELEASKEITALDTSGIVPAPAAARTPPLSKAVAPPANETNAERKARKKAEHEAKVKEIET